MSSRSRVILARPIRNPSTREYGRPTEGSVEGSPLITKPSPEPLTKPRVRLVEGSDEGLVQPTESSTKQPKTAVVKEPHSPPSKRGRESGGFPVFVLQGPEKLVNYEQEAGQALAAAKHLAEQLTKAERKALADHLALLALSDGGSTRDQDMWAVALYEALQRAIGTQGGGLAGPMALKPLWTARASWAPVESFAAAVGLDEMKVAERRSAYMMLARLLVSYAHGVARAVGAPLTGKFLANSTGNLAAVFEASFPGYAAAGAAPMIFRRLVREGMHEDSESR